MSRLRTAAILLVVTLCCFRLLVAQEGDLDPLVVYRSVTGDTPDQRRQRASKVKPRLQALEDQFDVRTFEAAGGEVLPYRLFRPRDYDPRSSYPLVVFFHGGGGRGTDNRRHIADAHYSARVWALPEFQARQPCFIVAPQLMSGVSPTTYQLRGKRVDQRGGGGVAGKWEQIALGSYERRAELELVVFKENGQWSGKLSLAGARGRQPANRWRLSSLAYSDGLLTYYFGAAGNERESKVEARVDDGALRGTLVRNRGGEQTAGALVELIHSLSKELSVDTGRVYITGLSMGGGVTWGMIAQHPGQFAAAVPVCGVGNPNAAGRIVEHGLAVWAFHGIEDQRISVKTSRAMVAALRAAGGTPKYTEYTGVDHNSWIDAYQDPSLHEWLFQQRRDESR